MHVHLRHRWMRGILATLTLFALSILPTTTSTIVHAAGQVGSGTPASCTESALRNAIQGGGSVSFNCGSGETTITLTSLIALGQNITIDGGNKVVLSGAGQTTIFKINSNVTATIRNLTIRDGRDTDPEPMVQGGAVAVNGGATATFENVLFENNDGVPGGSERGGGAISTSTNAHVIVRDSLFTNNSGVNGGAINLLLSSLVVENSLFVNNTAMVAQTDANAGFITGFGGAIYLDGAGPHDGQPGELTIIGSSFENNQARDQGGALAIFGYDGDVFTIETSSFTGNVVGSPTRHGIGGAIRHGSAPMTVRDSTFANNTSHGNGGAIWAANSGTLYPSNFINLTLTGNRAEQAPSGRTSQGGALAITQGTYSIINTTIAGNYAHQSSAALLGGSTNITLQNSIIANNTTATNQGNSRECAAKIQGGNNLQWPNFASEFSGCGSGVQAADPQLLALAINGGPTLTMALAATSPAINTANAAECPETDQRLADRVGTCDIGAFEYGSVAPTSPVPNIPILNTSSNGGSPIVTISWGRVTRTRSYNLQVIQAGPTTAGVPGVVSTAGTQMHFGLLSGIYQMRVQACNTAGCSEYSAPLAITVTSDPLSTNLPVVTKP